MMQNDTEWLLGMLMWIQTCFSSPGMLCGLMVNAKWLLGMLMWIQTYFSPPGMLCGLMVNPNSALRAACGYFFQLYIS